MGRKSLFVGCAVAAATLTVVLVASPGTGVATEGSTITFRDKTVASTFVDVNHNGVPDPGDSSIAHEIAVDHPRGYEHNDSQCTVAGSVHAPGGNFAADFDFAITGGTGSFATARGYGHVHQLSATESLDTVHLVG